MLSPFFVAHARTHHPSAGRRHNALRNGKGGYVPIHADLRARHDEDADEADGDSEDDDDRSPNPLLNSAGDPHPPPPASTTLPLPGSDTSLPSTGHDPSDSNLPLPLRPTQTPSATSSSTTVPDHSSTSSLPYSTPSMVADQSQAVSVEAEGQHDHENKLYALPGGVKVGIAFGIIAAATLLVSLTWAYILYRRRRRRRTHGHRLGDDAHENTPEPRRLWPFSRTGPLPRSHARSQSAICNSVFAASYRNDPFSPHPGRRIPTVDMGSYTAHISRSPSSGARQALSSPDEKHANTDRPIPILPPVPVTQANIRASIASWFRRTDSHHPLLLNPSSGRLSMTSTVAPRDGSRRGSVSSSISGRRMSEYTQATGAGEDVPPVPTVPKEVFTREDAAAYYRSMWSDSIASEDGGAVESRRATVVSGTEPEPEQVDRPRRQTVSSQVS